MRDEPKKYQAGSWLPWPALEYYEVGDYNYVFFQQGGDVSLWTTPQERISTKFSQYDKPWLNYKNKAKLLVNLKSAGVDIYLVKRRRAGDLQYVSRKNLSL